MRSGTPSSSSTRNVSSHASREWITSGLLDVLREPDLEAERGLLLVARRVLVVEVEAALHRSRRTRRRPRAVRASSHSAPSFDASCGCRPDRGVHVGVTVGEVERRLRRLEIGADAHHPLDARGRAPRVDVLVAARRAAGGSGSRPTARRPPRGISVVLAAGRAARPSRASRPRAAAPTPPRRAAAGPRVGPGSPSRRHSSAGGVRDHRRREQRDDAQRLETVAEHLGDRVRVALLVQRPRRASPRCTRSSRG